MNKPDFKTISVSTKMTSAEYNAFIDWCFARETTKSKALHDAMMTFVNNIKP